VSARCEVRCWLVAVVALAGGCNLPGAPNKADRPVPANHVMDFNVLYAARCAGCHGADGKLGPAPPLNDAIFLAIVPDAELLRVVREGRNVNPAQKTPMPGFAQILGGPLTDAQVKVLSEGIKKRWQGSTTASTQQSSLPAYFADKAVGNGNKEEGVRLFARACAGCHGDDGKGQKDGKPLRAGAVHDPAFLALISDQELRRIIISGRPDLGMPSYADKTGRPDDFRALTSAEIDDLIALLRQWRMADSSNGQMASRD
jgi:cytochrome c oxidase cbb3-type subunit III